MLVRILFTRAMHGLSITVGLTRYPFPQPTTGRTFSQWTESFSSNVFAVLGFCYFSTKTQQDRQTADGFLVFLFSMLLYHFLLGQPRVTHSDMTTFLHLKRLNDDMMNYCDIYSELPATFQTILTFVIFSPHLYKINRSE